MSPFLRTGKTDWLLTTRVLPALSTQPHCSLTFILLLLLLLLCLLFLQLLHPLLLQFLQELHLLPFLLLGFPWNGEQQAWNNEPCPLRAGSTRVMAAPRFACPPSRRPGLTLLLPAPPVHLPVRSLRERAIVTAGTAGSPRGRPGNRETAAPAPPAAPWAAWPRRRPPSSAHVPRPRPRREVIGWRAQGPAHNGGGGRCHVSQWPGRRRGQGLNRPRGMRS